MKKSLLLLAGLAAHFILPAEEAGSKKQETKTEITASLAYFGTPTINEERKTLVGQFIFADAEGDVRFGVGPGKEIGRLKVGIMPIFRNSSEGTVAGAVWFGFEATENLEMEGLFCLSSKAFWSKAGAWFMIPLSKESQKVAAGINNEGRWIGPAVRYSMENVAASASLCRDYTVTGRRAFILSLDCKIR